MLRPLWGFPEKKKTTKLSQREKQITFNNLCFRFEDRKYDLKFIFANYQFFVFG